MSHEFAASKSLSQIKVKQVLFKGQFHSQNNLDTTGKATCVELKNTGFQKIRHSYLSIVDV